MSNIAVKVRTLVFTLAVLVLTFSQGFAEGGHRLKSVIAFLVIISVIVFVHEFGHYIVAKWAGVKIDTFSLGFGKEVWGWNDRTGTRWKISNLPLGGYVKMYGDATEASTPVEEIEGFSAEERQKAFYYKPLYKKAAIVVAGPLFNFLLTIAIFTVLIATNKIASMEPIIGEVLKGSAAEAAHLQTDDRVLSVNGDKVEFFTDIPRMIYTNLGTPVTLEIERGGKVISVTLTPKLIKEKGPLGDMTTHPRLGFGSKTMKYENVGLIRAVWLAVKDTYYTCVINLKAIGQMIMGERSLKENIAGPIGLAKASGQAADNGVITFFQFIASFSASLGLINLFPVPVLDGGHLLFYGIEAVLRRPPGKRFQEYSMRVGMSLVVMLMAYAILNDIRNWLLGLMPK